MTPEKVLAASTPAEAAKRFHAWLTLQAKELGYNVANIFLWSPTEADARGYGKAWAVCWEEGPYEWGMVTGGCTLCGPENGNYSNPGPFPNGISGKNWLAEMYNNFILTFHKN